MKAKKYYQTYGYGFENYELSNAEWNWIQVEEYWYYEENYWLQYLDGDFD